MADSRRGSAPQHQRKESLSQSLHNLVRTGSLSPSVQQPALTEVDENQMEDQLQQQQQQQQENVSLNSEDYEMQQAIGYGSSATVYAATYRPLGKQVAIKLIDLDLFERNQIDELRRELQIMTLSRHPNVLPVYASYVSGHHLHIVTPFISVGSCLDLLRGAFPQGMEEQAIATILKQVLQGMDYLHKNGHIHRDIKAGNILLDGDGSVYLADFGVSSSLNENGGRTRKTFVGTPIFIAPEVISPSSTGKGGYDYKADIWSFGITALELANGQPPYAEFPPLKVLMMTMQRDPPTLQRDQCKNKYTRQFQHMIEQCLIKDPTKRQSADKLIEHPFFRQQARKKEFLVTSVLKSLPPILSRPVRKPSVQQVSIARRDSWDFSTVVNEVGQIVAAHGAIAAKSEPTLMYNSLDRPQQEQPLESPTKTGKKGHVRRVSRFTVCKDEIQASTVSVTPPTTPVVGQRVRFESQSSTPAASSDAMSDTSSVDSQMQLQQPRGAVTQHMDALLKQVDVMQSASNAITQHESKLKFRMLMKRLQETVDDLQHENSMLRRQISDSRALQ